MATFTLQSPGKATGYPHDVALETAPVADIEHDVKSIPDSTDSCGYNFRLPCTQTKILIFQDSLIVLFPKKLQG